MSKIFNQPAGTHVYVAIMAGGIGSRFWPISRTHRPKQFLDILGSGKTLIQQTVERFKKFVPAENIFIVTADDYVAITQEQLPELPEENIIGEPLRKNTAPCVAYISFKLLQKDKDACLLVAPSDHLIMDDEAFADDCKRALSFAFAHRALLTFGIKPTYANTGYGYIQYEATATADGVHTVKAFTEKPDKALAKLFLESGEYLWNSGIFCWRADSIVAAIQNFLPEIFELFDAVKDSFNTEKEKSSVEKIFALCKNISIDVGVMEKAENVYIIPAAFDWSDLGTWNSAWENMEQDDFENAAVGNHVMTVKAARCIIHTTGEKLVLVQGLEDYIVVDTNDVLLICQKEKEQAIKEFVAGVKAVKGEQFL